MHAKCQDDGISVFVEDLLKVFTIYGRRVIHI